MTAQKINFWKDFLKQKQRPCPKQEYLSTTPELILLDHLERQLSPWSNRLKAAECGRHHANYISKQIQDLAASFRHAPSTNMTLHVYLLSCDDLSLQKLIDCPRLRYQKKEMKMVMRIAVGPSTKRSPVGTEATPTWCHKKVPSFDPAAQPGKEPIHGKNLVLGKVA